MNKRMLYVSTPKCASTSIRKFLDKKYPDTITITRNQTGVGYHQLDKDSKHGDLSCLDTSDGPVILNFWKPPIWESTLSDASFRTHDNLLFDNDRFYKWTVVRNPWHRVASVYEYINSRKFGCHQQELDQSFSDYIDIVTRTPVPDLCRHENPERYIGEQFSYDILRTLATVSSYESKCITGRDPYITSEGVGCMWSIFPYKGVMKKCVLEVSVHTQRWENSVLFPGCTTVGFPDLPTLREYLGDAEMTPVDDAHFRYHVLCSPNAANISKVQEFWDYPHQLDKVVKFEDLKQGIEEVCSDLGVETWDLPHLNSRDVFDKNRHYEEMYEGREDLIEAVRNWYGYEIVAFDYEFGTYL